MTKVSHKILVAWTIYILASLFSLRLPHHYHDPMAWINLNLQVLLFILCLYIAKNSAHQSRPIFINFAVLFFFAFLSFSTIFVGTVLSKNSTYAFIISHIYVTKIGLNFILAVCLVYLSFDYFFHRLKIFQKYVLTLFITVTVFLPLFNAYIFEPLSLYKSEEYAKYLQVKKAYTNLSKESGNEPTDSEIHQAILNSSAAKQTGKQPLITKTDIEHLKVYLPAGAETILFWKPLNVNIIYVNFSLVLLLALFVFHKYWNDKPHPAYLEKIAMLFIMWCTFDAFHQMAFINTRSLELYRTLVTIGNYLSIFTLLLLVYVFSMRLRFVLSASGKYYEDELLLHSESITRWRDEIDTFVVNYFFTSKKFFGRLLALKNIYHS